jgi:hypothetical protein
VCLRLLEFGAIDKLKSAPGAPQDSPSTPATGAITMICDQTRRIVTTTSARSARFDFHVEPGLLMLERTPMMKAPERSANATAVSLLFLMRMNATDGRFERSSE